MKNNLNLEIYFIDENNQIINPQSKDISDKINLLYKKVIEEYAIYSNGKILNIKE